MYYDSTLVNFWFLPATPAKCYHKLTTIRRPVITMMIILEDEHAPENDPMVE
jgi:hypothetical protein